MTTISIDFPLTLATFTSGLFAGTCLYAAAVAIPVRNAEAPEVARRNFEQVIASLARSERMQPALHAASMLALLFAILFRNDVASQMYWALAFHSPILPLSLGFSRPVYGRIRSAQGPASAPSIQHDFKTFQYVHAVRTIFACLGFAALAAR